MHNPPVPAAGTDARQRRCNTRLPVHHRQAGNRRVKVRNRCSPQAPKIDSVQIGTTEGYASEPRRDRAASGGERCKARGLARGEFRLELRGRLGISIVEQGQRGAFGRNCEQAIREDHRAPEIAVFVEGDAVDAAVPETARSIDLAISELAVLANAQSTDSLCGGLRDVRATPPARRVGFR